MNLRRLRKLRRHAALPRPAVEVPADPILVRPDGYCWRAPDGHQEFGPFETREAALINLNAGTVDFAADETLPEAERVIGVAEWIDPETGEPAEGQSPPHLEQDGALETPGLRAG